MFRNQDSGSYILWVFSPLLLPSAIEAWGQSRPKYSTWAQWPRQHQEREGCYPLEELQQNPLCAHTCCASQGSAMPLQPLIFAQKPKASDGGSSVFDSLAPSGHKDMESKHEALPDQYHTMLTLLPSFFVYSLG